MCIRDRIESWEDMASKNGSIISPAIFEEFLAPNFQKMRRFADAHRIPLVLVDSDGNINALARQMHANGVNAMYPFEVGAGCCLLYTSITSLNASVACGIVLYEVARQRQGLAAK